MKNLKNKKGFTIVELVIVIAVIAILAAVLIPTFSSVIDKANESKALQQVTNAYKEAIAEALSDGVVPTTGESEVVVKGGYTFTFTNAQNATITVYTEAVDDVETAAGYNLVNGVITKTN